MKTQNQILQEEMRKLISKSCALEHRTNGEFYSFQKALLKFFFNVVDAVIDHQNKTITLLKTHTTNMAQDKLYTMNDAVSVTISFTNLEETLKGCLENGMRQTQFYQNMIFHYNHIEQDKSSTSISA
jgi:transcription termination factor NusB